MRPKCERCDSMAAEIERLKSEYNNFQTKCALDCMDACMVTIKERDRWKLMAEQMAEALERIDNRAWIHCNPDSVILHARGALAKFDDLKQKDSK